MNNLWRRISKRKSSSESSSDKNATQNNPQEPERARDELVLLGNPAKRFDWEDVKRANWEVLGEGTVGTTYKVDLEDGITTVVVKRLKDVVLSAEDFGDVVESLGAMDYENLLPLRGYYYSKDQKLLLYDYMPLGSLSDQLNFEYDEWRLPSLSWEVRLSIALAAARAIEYLHFQRRPNDHHGNIKSSNVLLTPSYEARVSDCGLGRLTRSSPSGGPHPTMGDVYDFGVLLLELLTGKLHTQPRVGDEGVDLPAWVRSVARKRWNAVVFDVELMTCHGVDERMVELLNVAMRCVSLSPNGRPWMSDVRKKIEELCSHGGRQDGDSQSDKVSEGTGCESPSFSWLIPSPEDDGDSQLDPFSQVNNDMYTREPEPTCASQSAVVGLENDAAINNLWRTIGKRKYTSKSSSDKDATQDELVLLGNPTQRFNWEDVKRANWEVLGEGTVGTTYQVDLENGSTTVVVKRFKDVVVSAEDFQDAVKALGEMDHENLLPLRGYLHSKDEKLLLHDYMPLGSLSDQLNFEYASRRRPSLSWEDRLWIALGAARAIEHLHAHDIPHGNIKSSNVLIMPSYEARVSDYGLAPLTRSSHPTVADLYGFGVLLLELLTGKLHNTQPWLGEEGVDLPAWVLSVAREEWTAQVLDHVVEEGMIELLEVAIRCVSSNPNERPWMSDVRRKIEELCIPGKRESSSKSSSDKDATQDELVLLGNSAERFNWEDVKRANWEVLGEGTVGTTYQVDLKNGSTTVVMKRLKDVVVSTEDFQDAVEDLGAMDHENLLPLRGYLHSKDEKLLLYDFMPLGSLSDQLNFEYASQRRSSLSWEDRLWIALGAARAIEHLHAHDIPHGNIKSSNVLIMPSYEARVSDYGLAPLTRSSHPTLADLYGFGVLLLELLTGKLHNTQPWLGEEGVDLPAWVLSVAREEWTAQVLDHVVEEGMIELLEVAIRCVSSNPNERPWMSDVRRKIEQLCIPGKRKSSSKSSSDKDATQDELVLLGNSAERFNWEDVKRANWEVLGEGTVGTTYQVDLENGSTTVVVKSLKDVVVSAEDFQDAVEDLGAMDHENLLPLRGYLHSKDEKLLLYEYMPLGSLSDQLNFEYASRRWPSLSWEDRLWIALGAARAIEHLHTHDIPHGNIKSSNILLMTSYGARLSDYGLAPLTRSSHPTVADLYGFGVLLLELLTGKLHNTQAHLGEEGVDLPAWVQSVAREEWTAQVLDVVEEGMVELLEVAIRCVSPNPNERPWMSDVRRKIEELCIPGRQLDGDSRSDKASDGSQSSFSIPIPEEDRDSQLDPSSEVNNDIIDVYTRKPPASTLRQMLSSQLEAPVHSALDGSHASSDFAFSSLPRDESSVSFSATHTKKNIEPLQFPKGLLVSSLELSQDVHSGLDQMDVPWDRQSQYSLDFRTEISFSERNPAASPVSVDSSGDEARTENQLLKGAKKIESQELQFEDPAVGSALLSRDACTSHEENEGPEWPIQSDTAFPTSTLLPALSSQLEASVHSALDGSHAGSDSASSSLSQDGSPVSFGATHIKKNIEPLQSPKQQLVSSLELSQDVHSAVTATKFEITSGRESAFSSVGSGDNVQATKELVHNSAEIPEMMMSRKDCQLDSKSSGFDYDVFLSFRGPDTRSSITDFLYTSLLAAGIHTYRDDDELRIGEEIGPELLKAINHSKISIPIFSKGYAFSKWCLNELVQMVECRKSRRQKIMPIFYDVTPSEVRHQTGSYGDALVSHEKQFDNEVISKWKAALKEVGDLKGWDIDSMTTRREGELVNHIVQKVIAELKKAYLLVTDCLVGIEHHVKEINRKICGDSEDIQILGICDLE